MSIIHDRSFRDQFCAGVDEVGRGPLAGAVIAAAVILDPDSPVAGLADSKALSAKRREALDIQIREQALAYCIARADVDEIDRINILQASLVAMQRAVSGLAIAPRFVLVDGNRTPDCFYPSDYLVKGDSRFDAIKAASIIAKVARDREMVSLDETYPEYGLARHKGYPTKEHLGALKRLGPSPIHRLSFAPCRDAEISE